MTTIKMTIHLSTGQKNYPENTTHLQNTIVIQIMNVRTGEN